MNLQGQPGRAYLDHASTSALRPQAAAAMQEWLGFADPGRVHTEGRMARAALEDARSSVAAMVGTRSRQVIFTSGATEAINAAVFGALHPDPTRSVVMAAVEHSAVREASVRAAAHISWIPVDREGTVDAARLAAAVSAPGVGLVHCQMANHEVGTIQPVAEVAEMCRRAGVLLHVDAAAAVGHLPITFDDLGVDLMSITAHKMGGPRAIGALLVRRGLRVDPLIVGGEQERARRGGLENVAAAAGFGAVASLLGDPAALAAEASTGARLTDALRGAIGAIPGIDVYGPMEPSRRLSHLVCFGVGGVEAEPVLIGLDQSGVAAHSGSSCSSESLEPSPVLEAMGVDAERSLRLSVGWSTTDDDVARAGEVLPGVIGRLRDLRTGS